MYKPKILIAAEIFPPTIGGPSSWLERVIPEFKAKGFEIKVVTFGEREEVKDLGVETRCISLQNNKWIRWYKYIRLLKREAVGFDIVLALGDVISGLAAIKVKKKLNIPVVLRVPGDFAWEKAQAQGIGPVGLDDFYNKKFNFFIEWLKKKQVKVAYGVDRLVVNSNYQKQALEKYWGVEKEKIEVIRNIFDIKDKIDITKIQAKEELGWKKNTIITVGRLIELKGNKEMIEFTSTWFKNNPDWQLIVIGDGPQRKELEGVIKKNNLEDQIKLVGHIKSLELLKYYRAADAYAIYSLHEGSPNTALEAINFDLPVIASNRGGTTELIEKYEKGLLVDWGAAKELETAFGSINDLNNKVVSEENDFFKDYNVENIVNKWTNIFFNTKK